MADHLEQQPDAAPPGMTMACPFCDVGSRRILCERDYAFAILDAYPVSPGHALVIPRRHVASFFDTTPAEREALFGVLDEARLILDRERRPDGYNIGINGGTAAGQTVMHLHVHLIPRFDGDRADPRGGVRWIFPEKAAYWKE